MVQRGAGFPKRTRIEPAAYRCLELTLLRSANELASPESGVLRSTWTSEDPTHAGCIQIRLRLEYSMHTESPTTSTSAVSVTSGRVAYFAYCSAPPKEVIYFMLEGA